MLDNKQPLQIWKYMFLRGESQNSSTMVKGNYEDWTPARRRSAESLETAPTRQARPAQQEYMEIGSKRTQQLCKGASKSLISI